MFKLQSYLIGAGNIKICQLSQLRFLASAPTPMATAIKPDQNSNSFKQEWRDAKPYKDIPTMGLFKMLRNFMPGGKYARLDIADMVMAMRSELGPISKMKGVLGRPDSVLTHNPEDFETLLHNQGIWPNRPGSEGLSYHRQVHRADFFQGVEGLISSQGEHWGSFRSTVNPVLLQPKNVRMYFGKISDVNKELLNRIIVIRHPQTQEVPANFEDELNRWALESISIVALDKKLGLLNENHDNPDVRKLFTLLTDFFIYSVDVEFKPPIWKYYKTKSFRNLMRTLDDITDITGKYVDEAMEHIEERRRKGLPEKAVNDQSILEKLIKIDKKIATVMAMELLMAGVDTTTSALAGLLLSLAKNPEKQSKLRQEIMKVLPHRDSEFDEVAFRNMPYLRACIKESLRLYPLAIANARVSCNDMVLSGYRVPKGTQTMAVNMTLLNNDLYYPRSKEYLPERWLRSADETSGSIHGCAEDLKPRNPFAYFPFGFGARSCISRRIVDLEIEMAISRLVRNFYIEFNHPTKNAFKNLRIIVPNIPLKFKFKNVEY